MKGRVQLYRLSLFLGYPCRYLKLQFSVVFRNDMGKEASSTFNVGGNDYLRVAPHPYITMDFVSDVDRNEIWSRNKQFRLDRFGKFQFVKRGKLTELDFNTFDKDELNKKLLREIPKIRGAYYLY